MKAFGEPRRVMKATNCNGPEQAFVEQDFDITNEDVGVARPHYLGFGQLPYIFKSRDVGRTIRVTSQGVYTCWSFTK